MKTSDNVSQPRLILLAVGAVAIGLGLWHFGTRGELVANSMTRATRDLNGLSMLFAGVVTLAVGWMSESRHLLAGYSALSGVYFAGYGWILLFARISLLQAFVVGALAVASLFAASTVWNGPTAEKTRPAAD